MMNRKPEWSDHTAAAAAVKEAQERQERVHRQGKKARKVTQRLWALGQRNHFQESIWAIFGADK